MGGGSAKSARKSCCPAANANVSLALFLWLILRPSRLPEVLRDEGNMLKESSCSSCAETAAAESLVSSCCCAPAAVASEEEDQSITTEAQHKVCRLPHAGHHEKHQISSAAGEAYSNVHVGYVTGNVACHACYTDRVGSEAKKTPAEQQHREPNKCRVKCGVPVVTGVSSNPIIKLESHNSSSWPL